MRVGLGYDVHPYAEDDRVLILGGVRFEGERGLAGHSDADALAHAVADAILSVSGVGDIGTLFPDTDERWAGASSLALLERAAAAVVEAGWRVLNVDAVVVLDRPKLSPHRQEIEQRLSAAVGAPVTVKAKRTEGLGALGRGEGIACQAVALLEEVS